MRILSSSWLEAEGAQLVSEAAVEPGEVHWVKLESLHAQTEGASATVGPVLEEVFALISAIYRRLPRWLFPPTSRAYPYLAGEEGGEGQCAPLLGPHDQPRRRCTYVVCLVSIALELREAEELGE